MSYNMFFPFVKYIKALLLVAITAAGTAYNADAGGKRRAMPAQATTDSPEISFIADNLQAALQKAGKEKKLIFVDAYATWCTPCKLLKATTFKDKEAAAFFNMHFINLSLDVEKGKAPDLAARWKIQGLPALLVLDAHGNIVAQSVGYLKAEDLIAFGKDALAKKL